MEASTYFTMNWVTNKLKAVIAFLTCNLDTSLSLAISKYKSWNKYNAAPGKAHNPLIDPALREPG